MREWNSARPDPEKGRRKENGRVSGDNLPQGVFLFEIQDESQGCLHAMSLLSGGGWGSGVLLL